MPDKRSRILLSRPVYTLFYSKGMGAFIGQSKSGLVFQTMVFQLIFVTLNKFCIENYYFCIPLGRSLHWTRFSFNLFYVGPVWGPGRLDCIGWKTRTASALFLWKSFDCTVGLERMNIHVWTNTASFLWQTIMTRCTDLVWAIGLLFINWLGLFPARRQF